MIKKFDTNFSSTPVATGGSGTSTSGGSGNSTKTLITIAVVLVVGYLGYKYVVKPMLDKKKEEQ